jgi:transcriptional regulator with XRE-family HTH domain
MKKRRKYTELTALKGLIRERKTSYRELAKHLGISTNTFSDKINGFYAFDGPEMEAIAKYLDISPFEIAKFFMPEYYVKQQIA